MKVTHPLNYTAALEFVPITDLKRMMQMEHQLQFPMINGKISHYLKYKIILCKCSICLK